MIAACIELVEARGVKKTSRKKQAPEDREVIGLFYGKKYLRENKQYVADRYMIEHAYMVQAATRQRKKVSWKRWREQR